MHDVAKEQEAIARTRRNWIRVRVIEAVAAGRLTGRA
jgi:hypothetical protein